MKMQKTMTTVGRRTSDAAAALLLTVLLVTGCAPKGSPPAHDAAGSSEASAPAAAAVPDWSGVWVLFLEGGAKEASEDSFGTDNGRVPLTPEYRKLRDAGRAARAEDNMANCHPAGVPGISQHGVLTEYLSTPGRVTVLFDDGEVRRIHTDGRAHLSLDELSMSYMGDSIGHWDGATLVVDTVGFPYGELFQNYGVRATIHTQMVERIFLKDHDHLEIDTVLTDPRIFTQPYSYTRLYERSALPMPETLLCNTRDNGEKIDLTPPPEEKQ